MRRGWLIVGVIALSGCVRSSTVPVQGVVKLDGKPLAGASVLFLHQGDEGRDATGGTNAEGIFRLSTFAPNDGALPGKYKVVVQPALAKVEGPPVTSPEEAQRLAPEGPVQGAPATFPERYSRPDLTILMQEVPSRGDVILDLASK